MKRNSTVRNARKPARASGPPRVAGGFLLRFLAGAFAGLGALAWFPGLTSAAIARTVRHAAAAARAIGWPVEAEGVALVWSGQHLEIVPECTPLVPMILLASAIAAYPAPLSARATGIAASLPLLWLYNLARVLTLALVVERRPEWFEFVHVYLWQAVTLAACAGLFALWLRRASATPPGAAAAAAS